MTRRGKYAQWAIFNVGLATAPLWMRACSAHSTAHTKIHYTDLVGRGQLILLTTALAATAVAEIIWNFGFKGNADNLFLGIGAGLLIIFWNASWYASIAADIDAKAQLNRGYISAVSTVVFLITLLFGAFAIFLATATRPEIEDESCLHREQSH